jgi:NAD(P)-dependent dehydrogenase (short-subunit alcohol dehydrogenase family)
MTRTALVTGGNRGIGLEACRQLSKLGMHVVMTARDATKGQAAASMLASEGYAVQFEVMNVEHSGSVQACAERLRQAGTHIDVVINNAAICPRASATKVSEHAFAQALDTNVMGAWRVTQHFFPAMIARNYGRIVNVSSGYGSFAEGLGPPAAYSVSKAALNALTVVTARELPDSVKVNAMCPGWVRTDMGGPEADRSTVEAVDTLVWLATLPEHGPSGKFFRDRREIAW